MAFPLSTPPEIGALGGVGLALVAAAARRRCSLWSVQQLAPCHCRTSRKRTGRAFDDSLPITVVTPRLTGGMSLALADTSLRYECEFCNVGDQFLADVNVLLLFHCGFASSCFSG